VSGQFGNNFGGSFSSSGFGNSKALIDQVLTAVSKGTTHAPSRLLVLEMMNNRYMQLIKARQWRFLRKESVIDFQKPYNLGTLTINEGQIVAEELIDGPNIAAGLLPNANFSAVMEGQRIKFGTNTTTLNQSDYRINRVLHPKKIELNSKFSGPDLVDGSFTVLFDRYSLDEKIAEIHSIILQSHGEMIALRRQEFNEKRDSNPSLTGIPKYFTLLEQETDTGQFEIEVWPSPDKRYSATIDYTLRPVRLEDSEESAPLIPNYHLDVLYYGTLCDMYRNLNDPSNRDDARRDYDRSWQVMASDRQMVDDHPRVINNNRYYSRRGRRTSRGFLGLDLFRKYDR